LILLTHSLNDKKIISLIHRKLSQKFLTFVCFVMARTYQAELEFVHQVDSVTYRIEKGFVPGMNVPGIVYVNENLRPLLFDELEKSVKAKGVGGFLPALKQVGNVASLPGMCEICN
jgi:hypothetical protein